VRVVWLSHEYAAKLGAGGKVDPESAGRLLIRLIQLHDAAKRLKKMRALVPPILTEFLFSSTRHKGIPRDASLRTFLRVARFVGTVRSQWYLWPGRDQTESDGSPGRLHLGEILAVALKIAGNTSGPLESLRSRLGSTGIMTLGHVLDLAFRGDRRELAVEGLRLALGLGAERDARSRPYETFFLSLAAFMLDDPSSVSVDVTRESFRAAAKELLQSLPQSGIPSSTDRWRPSLVPVLSMRLSFNTDYRNEGERDGFRYMVGVELPTLHFAISDYGGLQASLFDVVAPLAEMALRKVGEYEDSSLLLLDVVRPRIGVWVAVPQLSRRLTVTAGVGVRFVGLDELADSTDERFHGDYGAETSVVVDLGLSFVL
jgi:hypothetical protein